VGGERGVGFVLGKWKEVPAACVGMKGWKSREMTWKSMKEGRSYALHPWVISSTTAGFPKSQRQKLHVENYL